MTRSADHITEFALKFEVFKYRVAIYFGLCAIDS